MNNSDFYRALGNSYKLCLSVKLAMAGDFNGIYPLHICHLTFPPGAKALVRWMSQVDRLLNGAYVEGLLGRKPLEVPSMRRDKFPTSAVLVRYFFHSLAFSNTVFTEANPSP